MSDGMCANGAIPMHNEFIKSTGAATLRILSNCFSAFKSADLLDIQQMHQMQLIVDH